MELSDKILQFTSLLSHQRKDVRLGSVISLFLALSKNEVTDEEVINVICEEVYM